MRVHLSNHAGRKRGRKRKRDAKRGGAAHFPEGRRERRPRLRVYSFFAALSIVQAPLASFDPVSFVPSGGVWCGVVWCSCCSVLLRGGQKEKECGAPFSLSQPGGGGRREALWPPPKPDFADVSQKSLFRDSFLSGEGEEGKRLGLPPLSRPSSARAGPARARARAGTPRDRGPALPLTGRRACYVACGGKEGEGGAAGGRGE